MMKHNLNSLKDLAVPPTTPEAKAAAIRAAMNAYDDARQSNQEATQAIGAPQRPTHVTSNQPRRPIMRSMTSRYAIAASIAATAVFLPAFLYFQNQGAKSPAPPSTIIEAAKQAADKYRLAVRKPRSAKPSASEDLLEARRAMAKLAKTERAMKDAQRRARLAPFAARPERVRVATGAGSDVATRHNSPSGDYVRFLGRPKIASNQPTRPRRAARNARKHDRIPYPPGINVRDKFDHVASNLVKQVTEHPVSTFSVDVDTASYSIVRRWLNQGRLPPKDAVRVEELINYFSYGYARPESAGEPFKIAARVVPSPWNTETQLVHIGIKGYALNTAERPRANLVLLIDVSGSMQGPTRLPLLKNAFKMLLNHMQPDDTIGIVTYASGSAVALQPTKVSDKHKIIAAIDRLGAGGSTAGAQGIQDAYRLAATAFDKDAVNRVILGTDGDFNVGITNKQQLKGFIERKRKSGIFLSILGVGRGNYNDALMQTLAQNGNGTAAYIDTLNEARKVLVEEASSTLFPIAKDVKIQFEFNPALVRDYRLIGYETRSLRRQDFNNDHIDAGDVGSGHAVTAIYEITPADAKNQLVDNLRYSRPERLLKLPAANGKAGELGFLKLRYKLPAEKASRLITLPVKVAQQDAILGQGASDVRFAAAVAAFGQLLKGEPRIKNYSFDDVIKLANAARGNDPFGLRAEFVNLVRLAQSAQP